MPTDMFLLWAALFCSNVAVAKHFTPQWAVHIDGDLSIAEEIALKLGFINRGQIFENVYHFEHRAVVRRSLKPCSEHHNKLIKHPQVRWATQQTVKSRKKRDTQLYKSTRKLLNDPRWPHMWYLNRGGSLDMNVQPAWKEGITGRGVVVTILDDGLERDHPDLLQNYDPQASYDVNNHDEDPSPRYDLIDSNRHGTRCAGEVAAVANNSICGVGIAFGANVGGVRMLDGDVTDAVEARSLSLNPQHIDIYSASWGPDDDGKTVDGPGELATRAFIEGVSKGRGGKGSIFIWASGNGGRDHDNCNCDGYTNSIWTLSISSSTENGLVPWYSEACSSTLATTYSSGAAGERQIVTTDLHHQCTTSHTGTSASAPLAAGICALALEANRQLTWRDMQHIVVRTARPENLVSPDWKVNGVGRNVSHSFGYGLMDAAAMVQLARKWLTVQEQRKCDIELEHVNKLIPAKSQITLHIQVQECPGVKFLEHVQAKVTLMTDRRGDIQISLTSPAGTRSTLLARRPHDSSRTGFQNWPFMTVHNWGEQPFGVWQLEIHNEGRFLANVSEWKLLLYGTETLPDIKDESNGDVGLVHSPTVPSVYISSNAQNVMPRVKFNPYNKSSSTEQALLRKEMQLNTTEDASSGTGCVVLARSGHQCIECEEKLFLYKGGCVRQCPPRTHESLSSKGRLACLQCHYSCFSCSGPNSDQCLTCSPDAFLHDLGLCLPLSLTPFLQANKWYFGIFLAFMVNLIIIMCIVGFLGISWTLHSQKRYKHIKKRINSTKFGIEDYDTDSDSEN